MRLFDDGHDGHGGAGGRTADYQIDPVDFDKPAHGGLGRLGIDPHIVIDQFNPPSQQSALGVQQLDIELQGRQCRCAQKGSCPRYG